MNPVLGYLRFFVLGQAEYEGDWYQSAINPEFSTRVLDNLYYNYPQSWGEYGFKNALNLDVEPVWYSKVDLALDKGINLLSIENNRTGLIWRLFLQNSTRVPYLGIIVRKPAGPDGDIAPSLMLYTR